MVLEDGEEDQSRKNTETGHLEGSNPKKPLKGEREKEIPLHPGLENKIECEQGDFELDRSPSKMILYLFHKTSS